MRPNPTVQLAADRERRAGRRHRRRRHDDDIQGAALGTDDREFDLRSERKGNGDGRVYSVTYRASDASDNTTDETDEVIVPKSQGKNG